MITTTKIVADIRGFWSNREPVRNEHGRLLSRWQCAKKKLVKNVHSLKQQYLEKAHTALGVKTADRELPKPEIKQKKSATKVIPGTLRRIGFTSHKSFELSQKIWLALIFSLPLDLLLFDTNFGTKLGQKGMPLQWILIGLIAIVLVFINKEMPYRLYRGVQALQEHTNKLLNDRKKLQNVMLVLLALTSLSGIEILLHFTSNLAGIALGSLAILAVAYKVGHESLRLKRHHSKIISDRMFWLEQENMHVLIFTLMPLILSRLIGLVGVIFVNSTAQTLWTLLAIDSAGLVFLLVLRPEQSQFIVPCRGCSTWTSIVLKSSDSCPRCDAAKFKTQNSIAVAPEANPKTVQRSHLKSLPPKRAASRSRE